MSNEFEVRNLSEELKQLKATLNQVDEERIKKRTLKRSANVLSEIVRQAVVAEPDIESPAMNSIYERGQGPSMGTLDAWVVDNEGKSYSVKPDYRVRQRAIVLNYGYPGTITANDGGYMRFTIDGVPTFRKEVSGPDPTNYWQAALNRFEKEGHLERIARKELKNEFDPDTLR
jgi:hypothetical protein